MINSLSFFSYATCLLGVIAQFHIQRQHIMHIWQPLVANCTSRKSFCTNNFMVFNSIYRFFVSLFSQSDEQLDLENLDNYKPPEVKLDATYPMHFI